MLKLEQQVVSLEIAKKLKSLNVKQESYFWWVETNGTTGLWSEDKRSLVDSVNEDIVMAHRKYISAFTVAELGELLPDALIDDEDGENYWIRIFKIASEWYVGYSHSISSPSNVYVEIADTEADARAKMLIYLIENKLIPPPINN